MTDELKIQFLGTGAAVPSMRRGLPSLTIKHDGGIILCDIGEGTQMNILRAGISPSKIHTIFISHLHGDHIFGLPGFLTSQQMMDRMNPLTVIGPAGIRQFYESIREISGFDIQYPLYFKELTENAPEPFQAGPFQVTAKILEHRTACYGYRFSEAEKPGKFDVQKAEQFGIPPGPLRSDLQQGKIINIRGKNINPGEVLGPPYPGRTIVFCTDTRPCENTVKLAKNASLLIHDSTFSKKLTERAQKTFHSTSVQAAEIAVQAGVEKLFLWHLSIRHDENDEQEMLKEAREIFPQTYLPCDFETLELKRPEQT
ncbi:ribonuclease Z [candidate division KSB1 bacterium]|nr:ribonuclease Z [candidate division KSB1 bacterium]